MVEGLNSFMIACRMLQGQLERACFHLLPIMLDMENGFEVKIKHSTMICWKA